MIGLERRLMKKSMPLQKLKSAYRYAWLLNPLVDKKSRVCNTYGENVLENYGILKASEKLDPEEIRLIQDEKIKNLIRYVYEKVPYYHDVMKKSELFPEDITSIENLGKMPLLNKNIIRRMPEQFKSTECSSEKVALSHTSGSTGTPFDFYQDISSVNYGWAALLRFYRWMGYEWGDSISVLFRRFHPHVKQLLHQRIADRIIKKVQNVDVIDSLSIGDNELRDISNKLLIKQPAILRGYSGTVLQLARFLKRKGWEICPKAVTTTAEVLHIEERKEIEEVFSVQVYDQYGCNEVMGIAAECGQHNGLHIQALHCIVEVVDDVGNPLPAGERGRIIITDLDNRMSPFIRYATGDYGSLRVGKCACGNPLPLMCNIEGRTFGLIRGTGGKVVLGQFFYTLLDHYNWVKENMVTDFEVIQRADDSILWKIVADKEPDEAKKEQLISSCKEIMGDVSIELKFLDGIKERTSGKRTFTRRETYKEAEGR